MKIIGALLVKNESDRFLDQMLDSLEKVCQIIVVNDDGSTDDTAEICIERGAIVGKCNSHFADNESAARQELLDRAYALSDPGDWIVVLDADETLEKPGELVRSIYEANDYNVTVIGAKLYDMWDETHYRNDELWNAHTRVWPIAFKVCGRPIMPERKLHCGRMPAFNPGNMLKTDIKVQHWGWSTPEIRKAKYERYQKLDPDAIYGSAVQYQSILDEDPNLELFAKRKKVLICAPVRQDPDIFREYIKSLDNLEIPEGIDVQRAFVLHNCPELKEMLAPTDIAMEYSSQNAYICAETHNWCNQNIVDVTVMKNHLLGLTLELGCDYYMLVDSDLILHPKTLTALLEADKDICAEIFWTSWSPDGIPSPNCWDYDHYTFDSSTNGMERYKTPDLHITGMSGACILVKSEVIQSGVNYTPVYNLQMTYRGEDRAFCIRASARDYLIHIDTHYPCTHLYRREIYEAFKEAGS